ncbi:MAG TPA: FxsA family protein [Pseudolabrys sp.]|nr:FxsA family protein [Pseudolabrys sp.]
MAKWLLLAILALPVAELATFVVVASAIGFGQAVVLQLVISFVGASVLRFGGGTHIARARVAMSTGSFHTLQADAGGALIMVGGILLLIPGFITDVLGVLLLVAPLRRVLGALLGRSAKRPSDGVVDLERDEWRRVPEEQLADRRDPESRR